MADTPTKNALQTTPAGPAPTESTTGGSALERLPAAERTKLLQVLRPTGPDGHELAGRDRINTLLSIPDVERVVPELPTQELFFFIQDIGLNDTTELIRYASTEQNQGFVDLGCWTRDRFSVERFETWFEAAQSNGIDELARFLRSLDPELLVLLLLRSVRVYDTREAPEQIPDDKLLMPSPDGAYQLEMDANDERLPLLRSALQSLYTQDPDAARRALQAARWELPSPLEEDCHRWRSARLEDMGFVPAEEAALIEANVDVDALRRQLAEAGDEPFEMGLNPSPYTGRFLAPRSDAPFLAQTMEAIGEGEARGRVLQQFVALLNRRLSLRGLDLGEWSVVSEESDRIFRTASIGLELLTGGHPVTGPQALDRLPLASFYRAGGSALRALAARARDLHARGCLVTGASPFPPDVDGWLDGLRGASPMRFQPDAGEPYVPFLAAAELAEATDALVRGEAVLALFEQRWGWDGARLQEPDLRGLPEDEIANLTFPVLLATGVANRVLGRSSDLRPLAARDVADLVEMLFVADPSAATGRRLDPRLRDEARRQLADLATAQSANARAALDRFVDDSLTALEEALAGLPEGETPDTRYLASTLLCS